MRFSVARSKSMKDAPENVVFEGALGRTLGADEKANVVVGQPVKSPYLAC